MTRYAIINADDFGFSQGVNQAIIQAHREGMLTSTSLMVTGTAAAEAVQLAQAHPHLGVGLHLVLVCGKAALPPTQIPHLVNDQGQFSDDPTAAGLRYQFDPAARQELRQEIRAQLETFIDTGLPLSHVDGHLHLHLHPVVMAILCELAHEFGIPFVRLPREELGFTLNCDRKNLFNKLLWSSVFGALCRQGEKQLNQAGIGFLERVYGLLQTGNMTEKYLLQLIPQIQADHIEIYAHPANELAGEPLNGEVGAGAGELQAFLSSQVKDLLIKQGFTLTNYRSLTN